MKVIYNNLIPFKGYKAINIFGLVFVRKGAKFTAYCATFYPLFLLMIQYSGEAVREGLATVFSTKIQRMLFK